MGLAIGNALGAASKIMGAFSKPQPLKSFIKTMDSMGVQVNSRYEATFSAIPQSSFFIQSINLPGVKQNFTSLYYDGKLVQIPQTFEYDHSFSMTVINDAKGWIYSMLVNIFMQSEGNFVSDSGYTIVVKMQDEGSMITLNGVRIESVGGLNFTHQGGEIQTFEVQGNAISISPSSGALAGAAGIAGGIGSLL